jgi:2-hydroxy-4-carboxymuconate semialdehyde hemiacetal dehydrogenase
VVRRIAILGYGAVAHIHAARIEASGVSELASVYGPDRGKASSFAAAHRIGRWETDLSKALEGCDGALICSPGPLHYRQATAAIDRVASVLVELPACSNESEALTLAEAAAKTGTKLHCAHTSRYLKLFMLAQEWLSQPAAGVITQVRYARSVAPRARSWTDDALLHHAAHPLDLLRWWFGGLTPVALSKYPRVGPPQDVALLAELQHGAPVSVSISYVSRIVSARMTLIGSDATLETDGFSFVSSDQPDWNREFDGGREYEEAIGRQDSDWILGDGIPWTETIELMRLIDRFSSRSRNR